MLVAKEKLAGMNENRRSYLQVLKSSTARGASKEEPTAAAAAVVVQKIAVHRGVPRPPLRPLSRRWQPPPDQDCCREERIADHMEQCMLEEEYRRCNE